MRSTDAGQTWVFGRDTPGGLAREGVVALFQSTLPSLHGATFMGDGPAIRFSLAQGAGGTWSPQVEVGGEPSVFGEVPVSAAYPNGRLLAGIRLAGTLLSDDGGRTFTQAAGFWRSGLWPQAYTLAPDPASAYGGTLYAGLADFGMGDRAAVYASEDGGSSWALRYQFSPGELGLARITDAVVAWGPDGVLYAGLSQANGPDYLGTMARSADGGRSWEQIADGYAGGGVKGLVVGRDGRLYASSRHGVWRTEAPLAVTGEAAPETPERMSVTVRPNPASGSVEVVVTQAAAGAACVAVSDARGREVALLWNGALGPGKQVFRADASQWPAGVYIVRASAGAQVATARLIIAR